MICYNCGRNIPDGSKFCEHCGAVIEAGGPKNGANGGTRGAGGIRQKKWFIPALFIVLAVVSVLAGSFVASLTGGEGDAEQAQPPEATEPVQQTEQEDQEESSEEPEPADEVRVIAAKGTGGSVHTFGSYDEAISQDADCIELDVCMSADGTLFIDYEWAAIVYSSDREIEAARGCLRLADVFDRYGQDIIYAVELKGSDGENAQHAAWALSELVDEYGLEDNVIVHSFFPKALKEMKNEYPEMETICLIDDRHLGVCTFDEAIKKDYVDAVAVNYEEGRMTDSNCEAAHAANKKFAAWEFSDKDTIIDAINMGVDLYFTTIPGKALDLEEDYR